METLKLEAVVHSARLGDSQALGELHRRFAGRVLGLCRHMLGSREDAEDACSDVFVRLPRGIASYNGSVPFERWLFSVAGHHCIDRIRRRRREQHWIEERDAEQLPVGIAATSPLNDLIKQERGDAVRRAIAELPEKYRIPLALRYYGELSYDEISEQLGLERNHVATLIFRAKQELRQALSELPGEYTS
jgi:RNA polymerase sigma-70 factor, ECF subfamily